MREIINTPSGARFVDEVIKPVGPEATFQTMLAVAERDLTGDALEARRQEIVAMAKAGGIELPPADPRAREQQMFDAFNPSGKMAATAGADGLPSIISRPQVEFWAQVTKDAPVDPNLPSDLLADVKAWLQTAAAPAQGAELLAMAERSPLIAQSLAAYAAASKAYLATEMSRNHPNKSEMRRLQKRAERRRKQPSPDNLMGLDQFTHGQYRGETPLARAKAKECAH